MPVLNMLKLEGKVLKLSMWMGALILAGLVQGAQDAQDVLGRLWPTAFRIEELGEQGSAATVNEQQDCVATVCTGCRSGFFSAITVGACYSFVKEHCSAGLNYLSGRLLGGSKKDNAQQR